MKSVLSITAVLLLVFCGVLTTRAQETPGAAPKPAPVADPSLAPPQNPSFKATLVVLEADWAKAATAKQIQQDLQAALKDVPVPENLRLNLAASGPQILFASEQAYLYRPEDLNELLLWLEQHKLIKTRIDCAIRDRMLPPPDHESALSVDLDVLPIAIGFPLPAPPPFVRQRVQWRWSFFPVQGLGDLSGVPPTPPGAVPSPAEATITVRRRLEVFEEYVGQEKRDEQRVDLDKTAFELSFPRNRVAVVHVFADARAKVWRTSTSGRGVEAILVVREASLSVPALEGRAQGSGAVRIAEEIRRISSSYTGRRSRTPSDQPPGGPPANAAQILAQPPAETLKIFSLQHVDAQTAASIISQLFGRDSLIVAVDERGNSLIARGNTAKLAEVEALLLRLDSQPPGRTPPGTSLAEPKRPTDVKSHVAPSANAESHAANYLELEKQAAQTAAKCQQFRAKHTDSHPEAKALKDRLRQQVSAAFEARQQWQNAELVQLRARLAAIEQSLAARERIRDAIIDRRVEDLLNPDLRWEPADKKRTLPPLSAAAHPGTKPDASPQPGENAIVGILDYDPSRMAKIHSRLAGRVGEVLVDFVGTRVERGNALVELEESEKQTERTGRHTVFAPMTGIVVEKKVEAGERVEDGTHLLTIADATHLHATFFVPISAARRLRVGQRFTLSAEGLPDGVFPGEVVFIDATVQANGEIKVVATVANEQAELKPGMQVRTITQTRADATSQDMAAPLDPVPSLLPGNRAGHAGAAASTISPAAELSALQEESKVVRIEKGEAAFSTDAPGAAPSPANQDWPEIERVLYADTSGKECGIDLDTGKLHVLPKEYNRVVYPRDEIVSWAKDQQIDLFYPAKPGSAQLTCVGLGRATLDNTTWEKVTREDLRDLFRRLGTGSLEALPIMNAISADYAAGTAMSHVYAFITDEGSRGIIQIAGPVGPYEHGSPSGVRIRYKIERPADKPDADEASTISPAAELSALQAPGASDKRQHESDAFITKVGEYKLHNGEVVVRVWEKEGKIDWSATRPAHVDSAGVSRGPTSIGPGPDAKTRKGSAWFVFAPSANAIWGYDGDSEMYIVKFSDESGCGMKQVTILPYGLSFLQEQAPDTPKKVFERLRSDPRFREKPAKKSDSKSTISPAAELNALQGDWKVVRVEKGEAAGSTWPLMDPPFHKDSMNPEHGRARRGDLPITRRSPQRRWARDGSDAHRLGAQTG